ncbi:MAG TPA: hypothetical protein VKE40_26885 [Gemmataceae bacterium]|nr:hypothetical protein [Gemmataceae bacterium]
MDPLLADAFANPGKIVIYILAVAGGFLVGNVLTLILCRLIAKAMFKKRMPEMPERALRVLGGLVVAALVAWLLFQGGFGWGLGGTGGDDTGNPGGDSGKPKDGGKDPGKTAPESIQSTRTRVRIEPATAHPKTFRFEGDAEALDLDAAKARLTELQKKAKGEPRLDIQVYLNSSAIGNDYVRKFIEHAHTLGFATRVEMIKEPLP